MKRFEKLRYVAKFMGKQTPSFYDVDWNPLMRVVKKIYDMEPDSDVQSPIKDMTESLLDVDINGTFENAVKSIQYLLGEE